MRSKRERKQRSSAQKSSKRKAAASSNTLDSFSPDEEEVTPSELGCVLSNLNVPSAPFRTAASMQRLSQCAS